MVAATAYVESVLVGPRTFRLQQREVAPLAPGWVRVRFAYCGVCGSDVSRFEGRRELDYPVSLGHELVGEVIETGADGFAPCDVVVSDLNFRCGVCDQCRAGRSHLCRQGKAGRFSNRALAQLGDLDHRYLVRVAGPLRRQLALAEPLSCVLHAKAWAAPRPGDRVLVIGAGGLGTAMAFALCRERIAFDITDAMASRLALIGSAIAPGGSAIADPDREYDVVFDLSGTESGLRAACARVIAGGRLCTMSHLDGAATGAFLLGALTRRDVSFKVSYLNGERDTLEHAAALLNDAWDAAWDSVLEEIPLDQVERAFAGRPTSPWCKTIVRI